MITSAASTSATVAAGYRARAAWTVLFEEALVEHNLHGREQRAEELYRRAVQLAPDQPVLHYNLWALLEEGDGRMDEALERSATAMDALYDRWKIDAELNSSWSQTLVDRGACFNAYSNSTEVDLILMVGGILWQGWGWHGR